MPIVRAGYLRNRLWVQVPYVPKQSRTAGGDLDSVTGDSIEHPRHVFAIPLCRAKHWHSRGQGKRDCEYDCFHGSAALISVRLSPESRAMAASLSRIWGA